MLQRASKLIPYILNSHPAEAQQDQEPTGAFLEGSKTNHARTIEKLV